MVPIEYPCSTDTLANFGSRFGAAQLPLDPPGPTPRLRIGLSGLTIAWERETHQLAAKLTVDSRSSLLS